MEPPIKFLTSPTPVSAKDASKRILGFVNSRSADEALQPPFVQLNLVALALKDLSKKEKKKSKRAHSPPKEQEDEKVIEEEDDGNKKKKKKRAKLAEGE